MNFNLIENAYLDWDSISEEFTDDFLHSELDNMDLKTKYGMTHGQFKECCEIVKAKYGLARRPFWKHRAGNVKYYYKVRNGFIICKRYGNDYVYLGFVPSLTVAQKLVKLCKEASWNLELCKKMCHDWQKYIV